MPRKSSSKKHNSTQATLQDPTSSTTGKSSSLKSQPKLDTFPNVLHRILSEAGLSEIITWLPHGFAWKVVDKSRFLNEVIPRFFNHKNFKSFIRQVNGWGFIRITKGSDKGSYYHKTFFRGNPVLARSIDRPPAFKAIFNKADDPPNFNILSLSSESITNQIPEATASAPDSNVMSSDGPALQTNAVERNVNNTSQSLSPSTQLYILLGKRQRQIKALMYIERIRRLKQNILLPINIAFQPVPKEMSIVNLLLLNQIISPNQDNIV